MQAKRIAIIGCGGRGRGFAALIRGWPHLGQVVAVAEPQEALRQATARECAVPDGMVFQNWQEFVSRPRQVDAVVIATMDREHVGPAVACLQQGYDVLLEKPMGISLEECRAIESAQRTSGKIVGVCHSLRYQKAFRKLKELTAGGAIGRVITVDQLEQVEIFHQSHSFVRGNWSNSGRSSFMLLAKSCHDLDFLAYLVGRRCLSVTSYGALSYFNRANAPAGSGERCIDCAVEPSCAFSAIKLYAQAHGRAWFANTCSPLDHSVDAHMKAIATGPYGRCVWKCDNDVVDHQVVAMKFEDDITATFTMTAFCQQMGRKIRVHGTLGEIEFTEGQMLLRTFADGNTTRLDIGAEPGGHGGGDNRVMREWLIALRTRDDAGIVANAQESLASHTIVFAAEKSRLEGRTVTLAEM